MTLGLIVRELRDDNTVEIRGCFRNLCRVLDEPKQKASDYHLVETNLDGAFEGYIHTPDDIETYDLQKWGKERYGMEDTTEWKKSVEKRFLTSHTTVSSESSINLPVVYRYKIKARLERPTVKPEIGSVTEEEDDTILIRGKLDDFDTGQIEASDYVYVDMVSHTGFVGTPNKSEEVDLQDWGREMYDDPETPAHELEWRQKTSDKFIQYSL